MPEDTSSTAAQSAAKTPAERVKELQEELKTKESDLAASTKARDLFKTDVNDLAKTPADIEKAVADAAKSLPQVIDEREAITKYKDDTLKAVTHLLGPKIQQIDKKILEVEKEIQTLKDNLPKDRADVRKKEDAAREAQDKLDQAQKSYDGFKSLEKDNFKLLADLKKRIDTLNDVPKNATIYVLLREMKKPIDALGHIPATEEEFETKLNARWTELEAAKKAAREAKLAHEKAKTDLASNESTLAALDKSRLDDLIAATDEFNK